MLNLILIAVSVEPTVTRRRPDDVPGEAPPRVDAELEAGTRIDGFRVQRRLGAGAMGEVYLAQDVSLGRWVALKLVREKWMAPEGLSRFLEEARVTARFSHPNIVTVHAFGTYQGRPYLALEYLNGESLRSRLDAGAFTEREALRVARAIAEGVAEAHAHGLVHADLKPSNVVIPRDGRVRIVDFGLARAIGSQAGATSGTHDYMAPERWSGALPSPAIDVWALGLVLFEMVTGHKTDLSQLTVHDTSWRGLAARCLSRDPSLRPTAFEVARELSTLLEPGVPSRDVERSPFRGLAAFTLDDAADFSGRLAELDTVVESLRASALVVIAGPSGIGKSSFVEGAIAPRLGELGQWELLRCRPGARPFEQLAAALGPGVSGAALRERPTSLGLLLARDGRRALLFVDQAEEAFTLAPQDAAAFFACLATLSADEPSRLVLTVRDDFLARLAAIEGIRRHLGTLLVLGPLARADLEAAITRPLARVGYGVDDPALPGRIASDVERQPAGLALLQFACHALWERRHTAQRRLLAAEYEAMRGPGGALALHADKLLVSLQPAELLVVKSVLLRLINADGTRHPRSQNEVLEGLAPGAASVVEKLLLHRLVVARREVGGDATVLELAHEALSTSWPTLAGWLDETHELRALAQELDTAAQVWERRGNAEEETWTGAPLAQAAARVEATGAELSPRARGFLDAGLRRQSRARRRDRVLLAGGAAVLTAVALGTTLAALAFSAKEKEAVRQQEQIRLAAADMGRFELSLEPFDFGPAQELAPPQTMPPLSWSLHSPDLKDLRAPGRPFGENELRRSSARVDGNRVRELIEARSGPAFLKVNRGDCPPSIIPLERLPGYTERHEPPLQLSVRVPTCAATGRGMVRIPEGPFYANVDDPETPGAGSRDVLTPLPGFSLDRTEVTRGAFNAFGAMSGLTGDAAAPAGLLSLEDPGKESLPIVGVTFRVARDYCRFLGKDLPTIEQWQKAVRGGVTVGGQPNPAPKREVPWLGSRPHAANLRGDEDGAALLAAPGSFPADQSPYGVVDLAGNVSEWTLSVAGAETKVRGLRLVGGANWDTPPDLDFLEKVTYRTTHPDQFLDFALGMRCASVTAP